MFYLCAMLFITTQATVTDTLRTEAADGYSITVYYPVIALENEAIGNSLEEYAGELISTFHDGFGEYYNPEIPVDWELEIFFSQEPSPQDLICIVAWVWEYSGGAHPNSWTKAFNYDQESNRFVSPVELLGGQPEFEAFSEQVMQELYEILGEDGWVEDGASPDQDNYQSLIPVPEDSSCTAGYRVLFPPYQVAPYAYGPLEVFIPAEEF